MKGTPAMPQCGPRLVESMASGRIQLGMEVFRLFRASSSTGCRVYGSLGFIILRGCAHGRAAHAEARGEQFLSMLRPLNSLKISKR